MIDLKRVLPDLKVNVLIVWVCPHCKAPNKNEGHVPLDIVPLNCNGCKKPVGVDCRLAIDNRKT